MSPKSKPRIKTAKPVDQGAGSPPPKHEITIVALGASAGGIEALTDLIAHLPADTGMGLSRQA